MRARVSEVRLQTDTWVVLAGGGTAGHVLPGLTIAAEVVKRGTADSAVCWVGSSQGVETRLVPEAGFTLTVLPGKGFQRRLTAANIASAGKLLKGFIRAWRFLGRHRPAVVVGLGGYASVACGMAAVFRRIPLIILEQNATAGAANRLLSHFSVCSIVAFRDTRLRGSCWLGNPVRSSISDIDRISGREQARAELGVEHGRRLVIVFGGSLGARSINNAVVQAVVAKTELSWRDRSDLHIRHITGRRDYAGLQALLLDERVDDWNLVYDLVEYEDDMTTNYAAAELVVCRAGATTVAELSAAGLPAILVPLPNAPRDHQTANARFLVNAGAAVMIPDRLLDASKLIMEVDALLADKDGLEAMSRATKASTRPNAASRTVDLLEQHALRPRPLADSSEAP